MNPALCFVFSVLTASFQSFLHLDNNAQPWHVLHFCCHGNRIQTDRGVTYLGRLAFSFCPLKSNFFHRNRAERSSSLPTCDTRWKPRRREAESVSGTRRCQRFMRKRWHVDQATQSKFIREGEARGGRRWGEGGETCQMVKRAEMTTLNNGSPSAFWQHKDFSRSASFWMTPCRKSQKTVLQRRRFLSQRLAATQHSTCHMHRH